jgi:hypothetical protein
MESQRSDRTSLEDKPDYCYTISELAQITNYNYLKHGKKKDNLVIER